MNDFFEEILKNLDGIELIIKCPMMKNFNRIKNITGNAINDDQLVKLTLKKKMILSKI